MPAFVNYFKRTKQGAKLVNGTLKSAKSASLLPLLKSIREAAGNNITDIFKMAADIFGNISKGIDGAGWVADQIPIIGTLGQFGKPAQGILEMLENGSRRIAGIGEFIAGKPITDNKSKWYDSFIPW